jgi:hypothetical protein
MAKTLHESKRENRDLRWNDSIEIPFKVGGSGPIFVSGSAGIPPHIDIEGDYKFRLELFTPESLTPIISKGIQGAGGNAHYEVDDNSPALNKVWRARLTNIDDLAFTATTFSLGVSYPGTIPLQTVAIPFTLVNPAINAIVGNTKVHLDRSIGGESTSYIELPSDDSDEPPTRTSFTIDDFAQNEWWHPPVRVYPQDINSSEGEGSILHRDNGAVLKVQVSFEQMGREMDGTFGVELSDMVLTVECPLKMEQDKITYDGFYVNASFSFEAEPVDLPRWLPKAVLNHFTGYKGKIANTVKNKTETLFEAGALRARISKDLTRGVKEYLKFTGVPSPVLVSLSADNSNLIVTCYNALTTVIPDPTI